jgi:hypothetical protein
MLVFEQDFGGLVGYIVGRGDRLSVEAVPGAQATVLLTALKSRRGTVVLTVDRTARRLGTPDGAGLTLLTVGFAIRAVAHINLFHQSFPLFVRIRVNSWLKTGHLG